jgi:hypothetical protein
MTEIKLFKHKGCNNSIEKRGEGNIAEALKSQALCLI